MERFTSAVIEEQLSKEHSADYSRRRAESERRALEASRRPVLFREEKIPKPFIKYKGVGPKDQETGVPIALRNVGLGIYATSSLYTFNVMYYVM